MKHEELVKPGFTFRKLLDESRCRDGIQLLQSTQKRADSAYRASPFAAGSDSDP